MNSSNLRLAFVAILTVGWTAPAALAGRGGFHGGMNGMPPGMSSRGGGMSPGMGMSGMNGMPPGMGSRGYNPGAGRSGMNGMPPGMGSRGYNPGAGRSGMNGMPPGSSSRGGQGANEYKGPAGGTTYRGPDGGAAYRGPGGNTAYRGPNGGTGVDNRNGYGGYGWGGHGWANPYNAGWYHGGWNTNYGGYGYGTGYPMAGYGMGGWGYSPMMGGMGGSGYSNPYYGAAGGGQGQAAGQAQAQGSPDYSQPIDTSTPPPQNSATELAVTTFDQSRAAFKAGDYGQALSLCDKALGMLPNDPTMHEFRSLVLFALGRYDESVGTLYAVLSAGPGWDWTTMVGLYPDVDTYTQQLRALEAHSRQNENAAPDHFLLGYHYQVQGFNAPAAEQFRLASKLQPADTLAAGLAASLSKGKAATPAALPTATPAADDGATPAADYKLAGTWSATPAQGASVAFSVQDDGQFTWKVTVNGKSHELTGTSTYTDRQLKLESQGNPPLEGQVTWKDDAHFLFKATAGGPQDPGLSFSK